LTAAVDASEPPPRSRNMGAPKSNIVYNSRFGGVAFRGA